MDWEMPEMNGIEAIRQLKAQPETKNIPVIMATGVMTSAEHLEIAINAGAIDYIRKPIEEIELRARISSILKLSRSYQEIKQKNEQLEDVNREKDGIIGIVAHDLKSPLNKIKGLIELIRMSVDDDEKQGYMEMIERVIEGGANLIRDLLDSHAIEHHESKVKASTFSLRSFLDDVRKSYEEVAHKKEISLELEIASDLTIHTDEDMLLRVMDNLLSNALKFSLPHRSVTVKVWEEEVHCMIAIIDQGPGISEKDQKKMFKKFQRLSAQPTGGESSTGLGLSIVKALVERLKGQILVSSKVNEGSVFTVRLPMRYEESSLGASS
jgi:signal transduction histidine kinase